MKKIILLWVTFSAGVSGFAQQFFAYPGCPQFALEQKSFALAKVKFQHCYLVGAVEDPPSDEALILSKEFTENGWLIIERDEIDAVRDSTRIEHTYYGDGRPRVSNGYSSWNYDSQTGYLWKGKKLKTIVTALASSYEINFKYKGDLPVYRELRFAEPGMDKNGDYTGKTVWWTSSTDEIQYDSKNRISLITSTSEEGIHKMTFHYDNRGLLSKTVNESESSGVYIVEYQYNDAGLLILEKRHFEGDTIWEIYKYTYEFF